MLTLPSNLENVCRLCLTESPNGNDLLPLFPVRGGNPYAPNTVVSKVLQCTTVRIEHYEGIPTTICEYCNARLEDWQTFREQCIGTDEYLKANYRHLFCPEEAIADAFLKQQAQENERQQQQQQQQKQQQLFQQQQLQQQQIQQQHMQLQQLQQKQTIQQQRQQQEFFEEMTELPAGNGDDGSYFIGEEISPEDMMNQQDDQFYDDYDEEDDQQDRALLVQQMGHHRNGIRVPKWSKEFGAKLNSLLHVVGGERPHQCKVCRKLFLRRPHCRRHVAQAHGAVIDSVKLPKNWEAIAQKRFHFATAPVQRVIEPVPPPPAPREDYYDPTPERPHQCEVCKKCFKRSQHLRRHRTAHLQIEIDRSEIMRGIHDQQKAQQQLQTLITPAEGSVSQHSEDPEDLDDDDVIALSDDDDDDDMGEEIDPKEFIGQYDGSSDNVPANELPPPDEFPPNDEFPNELPVVAEPPAHPRLSDIPHIFYGSEDEYYEDDPSQYITKDGKIRKRAPPLAKLPGERPYKCRHCDKTFKRSDHMKSHMKTHKIEPEYRCDCCHKGFRYRQNYLIHMKNKICINDKGMMGHQMAKPGKKSPVSEDDEMVLGD